jgi:hypothetical protein
MTCSVSIREQKICSVSAVIPLWHILNVTPSKIVGYGPLGRKNRITRRKQSGKKSVVIDILPDTPTLPLATSNPRWKANLRHFASKGWWGNEANGFGADFTLKWDEFTKELWFALEKLAEDPLNADAYEHYMASLATNTWQETNQTWEDAPFDYIIEFSSVDDLWDCLVGDFRTQHIWVDQLEWTCRYLKLEMP